VKRPLVSDELWSFVEPLLPKHKAKPGKRGRPPVDDRACLAGIVFVLQSGIPWWMLPQEMGCGSGVTCWRRLRYWQRRGVWKKLLYALLAELGRQGMIDWSKGVLDSQSLRAVFGGDLPGRILPIGPKKAPNGTSSLTAEAPPWPYDLPEPSGTTPSKRCRCLTTSRRSRSPTDTDGGVRKASMGTGPTVRPATTEG
jgi:transposase